jgi:hypothetical protein
VPHAALSFKGTRISIVYFTRKNFLNLPEEHKNTMLELGFNMPGPEHMICGTDQEYMSLAHKRARTSVDGLEQVREEDLPDEDEALDTSLDSDEHWDNLPMGEADLYIGMLSLMPVINREMQLEIGEDVQSVCTSLLKHYTTTVKYSRTPRNVPRPALLQLLEYVVKGGAELIGDMGLGGQPP